MSAWTRLPTLRALTTRLRALNDAFKHPEGGAEYVSLWWEGDAQELGEWVCGVPSVPIEPTQVGREHVSGNDTFDAVAAARRLLADARAKRYK